MASNPLIVQTGYLRPREALWSPKGTQLIWAKSGADYGQQFSGLVSIHHLLLVKEDE